MSLQIENALRIKAHAETNNLTKRQACIELGFHKSYYKNTLQRIRVGELPATPELTGEDNDSKAIAEFCNSQGVSQDDVSGYWVKTKQISAFVKAKSSASVDSNGISDSIIDSIKQLAPLPLKSIEQKGGKEKVHLELNLYDCHFGKQDFITDEGSKETSQRFKESINTFVSLTMNSYHISKITIAIGNDLFNIDNIQKTTTRGTPQDQDMGYEKMFIFVQQLVTETLLTLSRIAPLDIVMIQGNHDKQSVFLLGQVLGAFFSNHKDVRVDNGIGRKIRFFGKTAVAFAHGEKDIVKFPAIIYKDFWREISEYQKNEDIILDSFEWHCGHWHGAKVSLIEQMGIVVRFFGALSVNDRWHYDSGYIGNRISASSILHSLEKNVKITQEIYF